MVAILSSYVCITGLKLGHPCQPGHILSGSSRPDPLYKISGSDPDSTYSVSRVSMMVPGPGEDGIVFPNSAQDVSNLIIDSGYICRAWQQFRIVLVSQGSSGSADARLESCLVLRILNEDSKCSELRVTLCVKHTLQKKVNCLQQASLFNWVMSGSNPGLTRISYYPG